MGSIEFIVLCIELRNYCLVRHRKHHLTELMVRDLAITSQIKDIENHSINAFLVCLDILLDSKNELFKGNPLIDWILEQVALKLLEHSLSPEPRDPTILQKGFSIYLGSLHKRVLKRSRCKRFKDLPQIFKLI